MSEKRKPCLTMTLRSDTGKKYKFELFRGEDWPGVVFCNPKGQTLTYYVSSRRYRLRVNGRWFDLKPKDGGRPRRMVLTRYEFRDTLFRSTKGIF